MITGWEFGLQALEEGLIHQTPALAVNTASPSMLMAVNQFAHDRVGRAAEKLVTDKKLMPLPSLPSLRRNWGKEE